MSFNIRIVARVRGVTLQVKLTKEGDDPQSVEREAVAFVQSVMPEAEVSPYSIERAKDKTAIIYCHACGAMRRVKNREVLPCGKCGDRAYPYDIE